MDVLFSGCAAALVTPFSGGDLDMPALDRLIDRQIAAGADALVLLGTTGEAATLSEGERDRALNAGVSRVNGRMPVIAGCGSIDTRAARRMAARAKALGADAALVSTPCYLKTTQAGLEAHFLSVSEAGLPLILYNVPARTGVNLLPETAARIAERAPVAGVKEAASDLTQLARLARLGLTVYAGNDDAALAAIALGARGLISVTANVCPERVLRMVRAALAGDFERARRENDALAYLTELLFLEPNPIPVKAALSMLGLIRDEVRLPLVPLSDAARDKMRVYFAKD